MGEYHLRGPGGFRMPLFRMRAGGASNSCSGIFTLAFFAFSSLAPSSVEPLSPQRTWNEGVGYGHFIQHDLTMIQRASMEARTSVLLYKGVHMNFTPKHFLIFTSLPSCYQHFKILSRYKWGEKNLDFQGQLSSIITKHFWIMTKNAYFMLFSQIEIFLDRYFWDTSTANCTAGNWGRMFDRRKDSKQQMSCIMHTHTLVFLNCKHCLAVIINFGTLLAAVWWNKIALTRQRLLSWSPSLVKLIFRWFNWSASYSVQNHFKTSKLDNRPCYVGLNNFFVYFKHTFANQWIWQTFDFFLLYFLFFFTVVEFAFGSIADFNYDVLKSLGR